MVDKKRLSSGVDYSETYTCDLEFRLKNSIGFLPPSPSDSLVHNSPEKLDASHPAFEETSSLVKSRKKRKRTLSSSYAPDSKRVWYKDKELVILKGIVDYRNEKGVDYLSDSAAFFEYIKDDIVGEVSKDQLLSKIRNLKKKFQDSLVKKPCFTNSQDSETFDLSLEIWGKDKAGCIDGNMDRAKGTRSKVRNSLEREVVTNGEPGNNDGSAKGDTIGFLPPSPPDSPVLNSPEKLDSSHAAFDETSSLAKSRKKRKATLLSSYAPVSNRFWRKEDELVILKGIVDYQNETGVDYFSDSAAFFEYIKDNIDAKVSKGQLLSKIRKLKAKFQALNKIRKLKGKFRDNLVKKPCFTNPQAPEPFNLSLKIWGKDKPGCIDGNTDSAKGTRSKVRNSLEREVVTNGEPGNNDGSAKGDSIGFLLPSPPDSPVLNSSEKLDSSHIAFEETSSLAKSRKKRKTMLLSSYAPVSNRFWRKDDELVILKGIIDYRNETGVDYLSDSAAFFEYIKDDIVGNVSKEQLLSKIRKLKKKFQDSLVKNPCFTNSQDSETFDLSLKIWGKDKAGCIDGNTDRAKGTRSKVRNSLKREVVTNGEPGNNDGSAKGDFIGFLPPSPPDSPLLNLPEKLDSSHAAFEETSSLVKSRKKHKRTPFSSYASNPKRVWSKDDELVILKGIVDYRNKTGVDYLSDSAAFFEYIKDDIDGKVSKDQLLSKIRKLKKKCRDSLVKKPCFTNSQDSESFDLSLAIWGEIKAGCIDGNTDRATRSKAGDFVVTNNEPGNDDDSFDKLPSENVDKNMENENGGKESEEDGAVTNNTGIETGEKESVEDGAVTNDKPENGDGFAKCDPCDDKLPSENVEKHMEKETGEEDSEEDCMADELGALQDAAFEETSSLVKSRKKLKRTPFSSYPSNSKRVWSKDDELVILKGIVDYQYETRVDYLSDSAAFFEYLKDNIHGKASKDQLMNKIRKLKKKFLDSLVKKPCFTNSQDSESFDLSLKIWGKDKAGCTDGNTDRAMGTRSKARDFVVTNDEPGNDDDSFAKLPSENVDKSMENENGEKESEEDGAVTNDKPENGDASAKGNPCDDKLPSEIVEKHMEKETGEKESEEDGTADELAALQDALETTMFQYIGNYAQKQMLQKLKTLGAKERKELSDEWNSLLVEEAQFKSKKYNFAAKLSNAAFHN